MLSLLPRRWIHLSCHSYHKKVKASGSSIRQVIFRLEEIVFYREVGPHFNKGPDWLPQLTRRLVGNTIHVSYNDVVILGATYTKLLHVVVKPTHTPIQRCNDRHRRQWERREDELTHHLPKASAAPDVRLSNCFKFLEKVYGQDYPKASTSSPPRASVVGSLQPQ